MLFPELRRLFKRDDGEVLSLGLHTTKENISFDSTFGPNDPNYLEVAKILRGGMSSWSGEPVSVENALHHSVVYACKQLVAGESGFVPAVLMQRKNGARRDAEEHPMYSAMLNAPNDEITSQAFKEMLTGHCLMSGGGFAKIIRRSGTGTAIQLEHLLPEQTVPDRERTGQKRLVYVIKNELGATDKTYTVERGKPHDILHLRGMGWDGIRGYSVVDLGKQSIGSAIASERNLARFWANGGRLPYLIEMTNKFKDDAEFEKFRADWERVYSEPHKAPILENGKKYVTTGSSFRDAQGIENRLYTVSEICRWFNVSPPLVHDLSRATFSNIEQLFLYFKTFTLSTWLSRWEGDFWRCVLTPEEKSQGYFLKHNPDALLRGDFRTRMEGYASALQNGHLSIDEVREDNDYDPIPDGKGSGYHIQLNQGTLSRDGQIVQPDAPGLFQVAP